MSTRVISKAVLCGLGVLVLLQLLFYNAAQTANVEQSKRENIKLSQEIESLEITKQELTRYLAALQNEYDEIAASVPRQILEGFEDHEVILAGFLDYVKALKPERLEAKVTMQGARKYSNSPVPLFEHDIIFTFTFRNLSDAKKFLAYILDQREYPLMVRGFEMRSSGQQISGTLQTSLLIPARMQKSLFSSREEDK